MTVSGSDEGGTGSALGRLAASLAGPARSPPPVERWHPPHCGPIDIRIAADGSWYYLGSPIARPALVRLFASVLRYDPEGYVLVTPVERLGITVDDLPFCAVEMAVTGDGPEREIAFRTNVDDLVAVGREHPLRFDEGPRGGLMPAVLVRGGLWARVTRALTFDLVDLATMPSGDPEGAPGVAAGGVLFSIEPVRSGPSHPIP